MQCSLRGESLETQMWRIAAHPICMNNGDVLEEQMLLSSSYRQKQDKNILKSGPGSTVSRIPSAQNPPRSKVF